MARSIGIPYRLIMAAPPEGDDQFDGVDAVRVQNAIASNGGLIGLVVFEVFDSHNETF